jgi:dolichyl-phosphate-mannose-protein mannosyltransferase
VRSLHFSYVCGARADDRFDEVHFGGFASKYIRQVFFMDVHPPLAKLLITLSAKIGGFDGNFDFKDIGKCV